MIYAEDPSGVGRGNKRQGENDREVCLDDDKFGQMGSQQRPNHQIRAVGWPQSEISSIGGGVLTTIGYELGWGYLGNVRLFMPDVFI